jgi:membrane-bound serine protease (ClpP class)
LLVSWVGIALILVAVVFFAVDLVVTNHGLPTVAAVVAFVLGALTLFGVTAAYSGAMLVVLVSLAVLVGVVLVAGSSEALAARERPAMTGVEGMIGEVGDVVETVGIEPPGWVFVHGERWRAVPAVAPEDAYEQEDQERVIGVGEKVQVIGLRDGKVVVLPIEAAGFEHSPEG